MTSSRDEILATIKKNQPAPTELPSLNQDWIQYVNPLLQFETVLNSVGGRLLQAENLSLGQTVITELLETLKPQKIYSRVPDLLGSNFEDSLINDPHQLEDVDLAILPGEIAVAENAAIWIDDQAMQHRTVLFIAQHVLLTVSKSQLVNNMHEAYDRLTWDKRQFGVFVSGPSKTADIEQSLVIGAHGARSLTVLLTKE
ncbi:LUD domain-containing protein [Rubinisphaera sp.]|uniref:LutC/YkgG family protein n=1 Tax=Rubinisphaera sp. TaxID=2024857 RepID=UPI000C0D13FD|nr:LUD domain-containing protein [Rubinisphaera sp.]MBV11619.1 hypothetical protein [Rubinisphaera sp.]HCS51400.1 hypothetical protein [Planctomycetaceae bacterium]|tara:strand:+ start:3369 stop:3965 length:597 start_codon:yes stop_codon:yes gene_type:complete